MASYCPESSGLVRDLPGVQPPKASAIPLPRRVQVDEKIDHPVPDRGGRIPWLLPSAGDLGHPRSDFYSRDGHFDCQSDFQFGQVSLDHYLRTDHLLAAHGQCRV